MYNIISRHAVSALIIIINKDPHLKVTGGFIIVIMHLTVMIYMAVSAS